jgi:predicted  nucleic acid-binding Zn-ribbon protein
MPLPQIENLLIVQARDLDLQKNLSEQAAIPQQMHKLQDAIDQAQVRLEQADQDLKAQALACSQLEAAIEDKESHITRFKTQQIAVKKNEEYQALTQQIELTQNSILELEEQEIELMLAIDTAREAREHLREEVQGVIEKRKSEIALLQQKKVHLQAAADLIEQQFNGARQQLDAESIEHYDRVKKLSRRAPYIVTLQAHVCSGCHLRVSNEVSNAVAKGEYPVFCDQCARLLYLGHL